MNDPGGSDWPVQVQKRLAEVDGPHDPETIAEEQLKPPWVRKLERAFIESCWGPLPMNRAWSKAKRVGCAVGREFVMRKWVLEQFAAGLTAEFEAEIRHGLRDLEVDMGAGLADDLIESIRTERPNDSERHARLAEILTVAFAAPVKESADFFDGFTLAVRKRGENNDVWKSACQRASIYTVILNHWPEIPEQRPLKRLCEFILRHMSAPMERGVRGRELLQRAFEGDVRTVCNMAGLPTGKVGRQPRTNSA